ncbi:MAG: hypothetical protein JWO41_322 [Candidatus Saccharibacteria bacterium]|nr:hypothetical protein [Candidatus Saccharibacteria bacterium]
MNVIDEYLKPLSPDTRAALERLRKIGHDNIPGLKDDWGYGIPALKLGGKTVYGFAARKTGISLYPFSGEPIAILSEKLKDYKCSSGAIQIPLDKPISEELVKDIIVLRLAALKTK